VQLPNQAVDAASDANAAMQAENAALRAELERMRQRLAEAEAPPPDLAAAGAEAAKTGNAAPPAASAEPGAADAIDGSSSACADAVQVEAAPAAEEAGEGGEGGERTPAKQPSAQTALACRSAAAHAAPVAFYGAHRVFMAPRTAQRGARLLCWFSCMYPFPCDIPVEGSACMPLPESVSLRGQANVHWRA
jgi:hypothetical protein